MQNEAPLFRCIFISMVTILLQQSMLVCHLRWDIVSLSNQSLLVKTNMDLFKEKHSVTIQQTTCLCKWNITATLPCWFIYLLSPAEMSKEATTETRCLTQPQSYSLTLPRTHGPTPGVRGFPGDVWVWQSGDGILVMISTGCDQWAMVRSLGCRVRRHQANSNSLTYHQVPSPEPSSASSSIKWESRSHLIELGRRKESSVS